MASVSVASTSTTKKKSSEPARNLFHEEEVGHEGDAAVLLRHSGRLEVVHGDDEVDSGVDGSSVEMEGKERGDRMAAAHQVEGG